MGVFGRLSWCLFLDFLFVLTFFFKRTSRSRDRFTGRESRCRHCGGEGRALWLGAQALEAWIQILVPILFSSRDLGESHDLLKLHRWGCYRDYTTQWGNECWAPHTGAVERTPVSCGGRYFCHVYFSRCRLCKEVTVLLLVTRGSRKIAFEPPFMLMFTKCDLIPFALSSR